MSDSQEPNNPKKRLRHLCGAVNILPNDLYHQRKIKVVLFNVITRLNTNVNSIEGLDGDDGRPTQEVVEGALKKYLSQAYVIIPKIEVKDLNLVDTTTNITGLGYTNCCSPHPDHSGSFQYILKKQNRALEDFLFQKVEPKYEHYFKIFFIPDHHESSGGFSSLRRDKFAICFSDAPKETSVHELLHSLGLPHTFDGSTLLAKYVYEDGMTDNLMDYNHY